MYVDIDRFKSFNDHYGYARGDRAINFLSHVLCDALDADGDPEAFVGHVGGDDFVVFCADDRGEDLARSIVRRFDAGVGDLHDAPDLANGYLECRTRTGEIEHVPLITLTVALATGVASRYTHPAEMSDALAELKRHGKTQAGSVVVEERRSGGGNAEMLCLDSGSEDKDR
jgi:GGDEF domain-containing protein